MKQKKIKNVKQLFNSLKVKRLVDGEQNALLCNNFGNMAKEVLSNQMKNAQHESLCAQRYSPEIKQFALTLHYYSPKAY